MGKKFKVVLVIIGAVGLSTLAINASDVLRGIDGSLSGLAIESTFGPCGEHAQLLQLGNHTICVDTYEASADESCPVLVPQNEQQSRENFEAKNCSAVSAPDSIPWRFISLNQAQQLCARSGKRLPNNDEWYKAVSGITDMDSCVVVSSGSPKPTGTANCVSPLGAHDMVGNVWEWIDAEVQNGEYNGRVLPEDGYVSLVDSDGVVVETSENPSREYYKDYATTDKEGIRGIIRGGFYGSGEDAGMYALNASVPLDFKVTGVGFRCVKDV